MAIDTVEHSCGREHDSPNSLVYTASVSAAVVLMQMLAKAHSAAATTMVPLVDHLDTCI